MRIHLKRTSALRVDLQMTSMIDVVFQLLIFFILTFRFVQPEGDLAIKLPAEPRPGDITTPSHLPTLAVNLSADDEGELRSVSLNEQPLADLAALRREVAQVTLDNLATRDDIRVDLICDQRLKYQNVIAALTAVSGQRDASGQILPLATNVHLRRGK